jgi:hypothetical protein
LGFNSADVLIFHNQRSFIGNHLKAPLSVRCNLIFSIIWYQFLVCKYSINFFVIGKFQQHFLMYKISGNLYRWLKKLKDNEDYNIDCCAILKHFTLLLVHKSKFIICLSLQKYH